MSALHICISSLFLEYSSPTLLISWEVLLTLLRLLYNFTSFKRALPSHPKIWHTTTSLLFALFSHLSINVVCIFQVKLSSLTECQETFVNKKSTGFGIIESLIFDLQLIWDAILHQILCSISNLKWRWQYVVCSNSIRTDILVFIESTKKVKNPNHLIIFLEGTFIT